MIETGSGKPARTAEPSSSHVSVMDPVRASPWEPAARDLPHREAGHTTAPDRMHRADRRKCLRHQGRPHPLSRASARQRSFPAAMPSRSSSSRNQEMNARTSGSPVANPASGGQQPAAVVGLHAFGNGAHERPFGDVAFRHRAVAERNAPARQRGVHDQPRTEPGAAPGVDVVAPDRRPRPRPGRGTGPPETVHSALRRAMSTGSPGPQSGRRRTPPPSMGRPSSAMRACTATPWFSTLSTRSPSRSLSPAMRAPAPASISSSGVARADHSPSSIGASAQNGEAGPSLANGSSPRPASATARRRRDRPPTGCGPEKDRPRVPAAHRAPATPHGNCGRSAGTTRRGPRRPSPPAVGRLRPRGHEAAFRHGADPVDHQRAVARNPMPCSGREPAPDPDPGLALSRRLASSVKVNASTLPPGVSRQPSR